MGKEKVILSYSGGLDTSVIIPWLKEKFDFEVIALCVDVGQKEDWDSLKKRALYMGADKCYVANMQEEYIKNYVYPALKGGAVYEGSYLLGTATARPLIGKVLAEFAKKEGASCICHGATGKGNDQIRFELAIKTFAPEVKIIAAWRHPEWKMQSREDEAAFLEERGFAVPIKKEDSYSRDENLWHISHEGLDLERTENEADYSKILKLSLTAERARECGEFVTVGFVSGVPLFLDGKEERPVDLMRKLNEIGGRNGVGVIDIVENRVVGMKSRGVYETPGGSILYAAHEALKRLCLDKDSYTACQHASIELANLIYGGKWFTPLCRALFAFFDVIEKPVSGNVKLKLYKGNITAVSSSSPASLYNEDIASFTTGELYNHKDAEGFIKLYSLPITVRALMEKKAKGKKGEGSDE